MTEAIVNAVAHRDYTDNSSVQVMLFADRLEVMNSGRLPPPLTVDKLRQPHQSLPGNPLLAESMYLLQYIERMGTGTVDMIRRCAEAGLPEPEFEVGAGFLIRIWRSGDRETRQATGTARKQPENSQKTTGSQGQQPENDQKTARKRPENSQKTDGSEGQSPETPSLSHRILALLRQNPSAGRREVADALGTTQSVVRYRLDKLRAAGKIERIGPDKGGYWKVLGQSDAEPDLTPERNPPSSP